MAAGDSAEWEARRRNSAADILEREAAEQRKLAKNYGIGAISERRLGVTLERLVPHGYRIFADLQWPGRRQAQVDFIVVGPAGVFFIDAKNWRDVRVEAGQSGERVFRGDSDETDSFEAFADLANSAEALLAERIGLTSGDVHTLAVFTNRRDVRFDLMRIRLIGEADCIPEITRHGDRLSREAVSRIEQVIESAFPPVEMRDDPIAVIIPSPGLIASLPEPLFSEAEVNDLTVQAKLAEPIEEWMAFLDPAQSKTVRRSFNGPSRIRGAAGTGKTVVGLHRAAHLARMMPGKILVTTFISTLPEVLRSQLRRLDPDLVARIEFRGVHEFAREVLKRNGVRNRLQRQRAEAIFQRVWFTNGISALGIVSKDARYWHEEVVGVIKGRGLSSSDAYRSCARTGRRRGLTSVQRDAVWKLYAEYQREMVREDVWDDADVILQAKAAIENAPIREYSAVIVDEAQDLSCAMIQMFHALVGDAPDGLTLIGDGQQSIYPGGYTLAEAGISLAGRGVVLSVNYRNTVEIVEFASRLVDGDAFDDIEGTTAKGDRFTIARHGLVPTMVRGVSGPGHDAAVVAQIRRMLQLPGVGPGDIGVLARYTRHVEETMRLLRQSSISAIDLKDYRGERTESIRVGTIKRAKGLEFKQVLVVQAPRNIGSIRAGATSEEQTLTAREYYVAMTRARDGLWVGVA